MAPQPVEERARSRFVVVAIGGSVEERDTGAVGNPHPAARLAQPLDVDCERQPLCLSMS